MSIYAPETLGIEEEFGDARWPIRYHHCTQLYRVWLVVVDWVWLTLIEVIPLPAQLCFCRWEFG